MKYTTLWYIHSWSNPLTSYSIRKWFYTPQISSRTPKSRSKPTLKSSFRSSKVSSETSERESVLLISGISFHRQKPKGKQPENTWTRYLTPSMQLGQSDLDLDRLLSFLLRRISWVPAVPGWLSQEVRQGTLCWGIYEMEMVQWSYLFLFTESMSNVTTLTLL